MIGFVVGLRQKYQSFVWNLSNDPYQLICQFRAIFNFICGICGLDVYYPTFRIHWVTVVAIVTSINYLVFSFYTIWYYRDDPVQYLQVLSCYGVFVPNCMKMYMGLRFRYKAHHFLDFGENIYATNNIRNSEEAYIQRYEIIKSTARRTFVYLVTILFVFCCSSMMFLIYPMWQLVYAGQRTWVIPILIPWTTLDTTFQYWLNLSYQVICSVMAMCGPVGFDSFFTVCCCHHAMFVLLIGATLDKTEKMYTRTTGSLLERKMHLINFLKQLQDLDNYTLELNNTYKSLLFIQPIAASLAIALSLFCIVVNEWYSGYGYIIFTYNQMFILCALGQSVETNNSRLATIIYNALWYRFPLAEQKDIYQVMIRVQTSKELWMGPFAPLNFETGSRITQNIYTFAMMLLRTTH